jgi:substrate import-associated zinc metallohydrolase lipoprotein
MSMKKKYSEHIKTKSFQFFSLIFLLVSVVSCLEEEKIDVPITNVDVPNTELDIYIDTHFVQEYDMAIRYRFKDQYIDPGQRVAPPALEVVRPMLDFIEEFWIAPFLEVDGGDTFFRSHVPAELIFLGGLIFNSDGTVTLGTADAGARITFTNVNAIDVNDEDWVFLQLQTVYHEFAHIVHQKYSLPAAYETITPSGYTSAGSWFNLTNEEALIRGFVSPYSTSNPNEDFAEVVAFYLFEKDFFVKFIDQEEDCTTANCENRNAGRLSINQKLSAIKSHYKKVTGVDLDDVRVAVQSRL